MNEFFLPISNMSFQGAIHLHNDESYIVTALVKHLYGFPFTEVLPEDYAVRDLVKIHAIALKYDVRGLIVATTDQLCGDLDKYFSAGLIFSDVGKGTSNGWVWELAQCLYPSGASAHSEFCPLLREALVEAMHVHADKIKMVEQREVRAGLRACPEFATDVLMRRWFQPDDSNK